MVSDFNKDLWDYFGVLIVAEAGNYFENKLDAIS